MSKRAYKTGELLVSIKELRELANTLEQEVTDNKDCFSKNYEKQVWCIPIWSDSPHGFKPNFRLKELNTEWCVS